MMFVIHILLYFFRGRIIWFPKIILIWGLFATPNYSISPLVYRTENWNKTNSYTFRNKTKSETYKIKIRPHSEFLVFLCRFRYLIQISVQAHTYLSLEPNNRNLQQRTAGRVENGEETRERRDMTERNVPCVPRTRRSSWNSNLIDLVIYVDLLQIVVVTYSTCCLTVVPH